MTASHVAPALALGLCTHAVAQIQFADPVELTGNFGSPSAERFSDLDLDGDFDLLLGLRDRGEGNLVVVEGLGRTLGVSRRLAVGDGPVRLLSSGDIDLDGDVDLVAVEEFSDDRFRARIVLRGAGAEYVSAAIVALDAAPVRIEVADLDGDGVGDLVVEEAGQLHGYLDVLSGSPLGSSTLTASVPENWDAFDVDGDGAIDLATRSALLGPLEVARGFGGGAFGALLSPQANGAPIERAQFADIDGDGRSEILVTDSLSSVVRLEQRAGLVFDTPSVIRDFGATTTVTDQPGYKDFTGDGVADLFVSYFDISNFSTICVLLPGNASGSFGAPQSALSAGAVLFAGTRFEDVDGDGFADALDPDEVITFNELGTGALPFDGPGIQLNFDRPDVSDAVSFDVDRDGDRDLVMSNYGSNGGLRWLENLGGGEFGEQADLGLDVGFVMDLFEGDFDGDGDSDLLGLRHDGRVVVARADGPSTFTVELGAASVARAVASSLVVDSDGDGTDEILGYFERPGLSLDLGLLTRTTPGGEFLVTGGLRGNYIDLDRDGLVDSVFSDGISLFWRPTLPGGTQGSPRVIQLGIAPFVVQELDVDGDDLDDLIYAVRGGIGWSRRLSSTAVDFAPSQRIETPANRRVQDFTIRDLDLDGELDMVVELSATTQTNLVELVVLEGLGGSDFSGASTVIPTFGPFDAGDSFVFGNDYVVDDFDGDGDFDLAVVEPPFLKLVEGRTTVLVGDVSCGPSAINSSGVQSRIVATGTATPGSTDLNLRAFGLPANELGIFISSRTAGAPAVLSGSTGSLCLTGAIGRFVGPGQIFGSGPDGSFVLFVDTSAIPQPGGLVTVMPGDTWSFQAWFRDGAAGNASNLTDAVMLSF